MGTVFLAAALGAGSTGDAHGRHIRVLFQSLWVYDQLLDGPVIIYFSLDYVSPRRWFASGFFGVAVSSGNLVGDWFGLVEDAWLVVVGRQESCAIADACGSAHEDFVVIFNPSRIALISS